MHPHVPHLINPTFFRRQHMLANMQDIRQITPPCLRGIQFWQGGRSFPRLPVLDHLRAVAPGQHLNLLDERLLPVAANATDYLVPSLAADFTRSEQRETPQFIITKRKDSNTIRFFWNTQHRTKKVTSASVCQDYRRDLLNYVHDPTAHYP
jgi:hypothetical protein